MKNCGHLGLLKVESPRPLAVGFFLLTAKTARRAPDHSHRATKTDSNPAQAEEPGTAKPTAKPIFHF